MKKLIVLMFTVFLLMGCGGDSGGSTGGGGNNNGGDNSSNGGDNGTNGGDNGSTIGTPGKIMLDTSGNSVSRVYMDLNDNNQYDSGEPTTSNIKRESGYFSYSIELPSDTKSLKAEITGNTSGTSNLSSVGSNSYTLSSPAGKMLISPYTTMINNIMVSEGKTLAEAQSAVNASTGKSHDFFSESTYANDEVKKTSNYIANSIKNAVDSLGGSGLTSEDLNSIIIAVTNAVMDALKDVIAEIIGGSYKEDDKYEPADLDAMSLFAQGVYQLDFRTDNQGSMAAITVNGFKLTDGKFFQGEYVLDEYKNGSHTYNRQDLSKIVYEFWGSTKVETDSKLTINTTQPMQLSDLGVITPASGQIRNMMNHDIESYSDIYFASRINRTVTFPAGAQTLSFKYNDVAVDLDDPKLDVDSSTRKESTNNFNGCNISSTQALADAFANGTCQNHSAITTPFTKTMGGKLRIVYDSINEHGGRRTYVIWIENGYVYRVWFNEPATTPSEMTTYNKTAMEQILDAYFSTN